MTSWWLQVHQNQARTIIYFGLWGKATSKTRHSCWVMNGNTTTEALVRIIKFNLPPPIKKTPKKTKKRSSFHNFSYGTRRGTHLSFWYECAARRAENMGLENKLPQNLWSLKNWFFVQSEALGTEFWQISGIRTELPPPPPILELWNELWNANFTKISNFRWM